MGKKKQVEKAEFQPRGYEDTFDMDVEDLEQLGTQICTDLATAEEDKDEWIQDKINDVKGYFGIKKSSDWPFKGAAKISSQTIRMMVDTLASNLSASANAPDNFLEAKTDKSKSIENAKYVTDISNHQARFEYRLMDVLSRAWHTALIESFVVLKPIYQFDVLETVRTIKRWLPKGYNADEIKYDSVTDTVSGPDGIIPSLDIERLPEDPEDLKKLDMHECTFEVTTEHANEGLRVLTIPGEHIFLPIASPGETPFEKYQRAPYVIEDDFKTIQEMQILQDQGKIKNFELVRGEIVTNLFAEEMSDVKKQQAGILSLADRDRHMTRNVWWNGKYEYKGKLRELMVYMNYETKTILKVKINEIGIRPYFPQVPFPIENTPYGESLPKQIRALVLELELAINTILNMGMIKAYPPKFFDPNGGFDPKTLGNFGPNAYIPVRDPSRNVFMPPQPEDPRILMDMVHFLKDQIERVTANSDTMQGQSAPTNSTKYEIEQKLVRGGVRFDSIYRRLKSQLEPMFDYIQRLSLRFMPVEKEFQMMGEQGVVQAKDGSQQSRLQTIYQQEGLHGLTLTGNSLTDEQDRAQKAEKLYMMFQQDPYISFKPESAYYLRFNLVKHYNPVMMDHILAKPEEVAKLMRDRQDVQNEQEQKAVEDGKGQVDVQAQAQAQAAQMQAQIQAQMAQMEMQIKQQQAQLDMQKKEADIHLDVKAKESDMTMKEREHDQKLRQMEEAHALKLELMKKESELRAKEAANAKKERTSNPKS